MMTVSTLSLAPHLEERTTELGRVLDGLGLSTGRLSQRTLGRVVAAVAARPELFVDLVVDDPDHRWWMSLHVANNFDLRVLSWERDQESNWHDHGGSSGAYVVMSGSLREWFRAVDDSSVTERIVVPGQSLSFGPSHVHDVAYGSGTPAISVHAYSPPLSALTFYDRDAFGFVAREVVPEETRRPFELAG
jgi:mannose-6-phosphate isomerase-like protein (cupin superfamily)